MSISTQPLIHTQTGFTSLQGRFLKTPSKVKIFQWLLYIRVKRIISEAIPGNNNIQDIQGLHCLKWEHIIQEGVTF